MGTNGGRVIMMCQLVDNANDNASQVFAGGTAVSFTRRNPSLLF